jgi:hypothetical protein
MGTDVDQVKGKVQGWIEWLKVNMPALSEKIASNVEPVLKEFWQMLKAIGGALQQLAVVFTNVVGAITGDDSIIGTAADFDKVAKAVQHVTHGLAMMVQWITLAEKLLMHLANAAVLSLSGHGKEAAEEFKKAIDDLAPKSGGIAGAVIGSAVGGIAGAVAGIEAGPVGMVAGGAAGAAVGAWRGAAIGTAAGAAKEAIHPSDKTSEDWQPLIETQKLAPGKYMPSKGKGKVDPRVIESVARTFGVDPRLVLAVSQQESGQRQFDAKGNVIRSGAGALGLMQLMPATAKGLGVDPNDPNQNLQGGAKYLAQLLQHYQGDTIRALMAYNWGPGNLDKAIASHRAIPAEVQNYARSVENRAQQITIGDVNVHITQPGASQEQIQSAVTSGITKALGRQAQSDLLQLSGGY